MRPAAWLRLLQACTCLVIVPLAARGDRCQAVPAALANAVLEHVEVGDLLVSWCVPCGDETPTAFRVLSIELSPGRGELATSYREVRINGEAQDLAYMFVRRKRSSWHNLAVLVGCDAGETHPTLRFKVPDRGQTESPPMPFVETSPQACPWGPCPDFDWTAVREVEIRDQPQASAPVVARLAAGLGVSPLSSERHLFPVRGVVTFTRGSFVAGDIIYLLEILQSVRGEIDYRIWHYGAVVEGSGVDTPSQAAVDCRTPSFDCWATADAEPLSEWWVNVRTGDGASGWVVDPETAFVGFPPLPED